MDDFINVIKRVPKEQRKIKDLLDKYNRLPYNYQPKRGYDTLIQNVILKGNINLMGVILVDIDIELKLKISRLKYLEIEKTHINVSIFNFISI